MTYGWALVVIVIVIAVLVFLINPSQIGANNCTGFDKLPITDHTIATTTSDGDTIQLVLTNETGRQISVSEVLMSGTLGGSNITDTNADDSGVTGTFAVNDSETWGINIAPALTDNQQYDLSFTMTYITPDGLSKNASASCKGTYKA